MAASGVVLVSFTVSTFEAEMMGLEGAAAASGCRGSLTVAKDRRMMGDAMEAGGVSERRADGDEAMALHRKGRRRRADDLMADMLAVNRDQEV